MVGPLLINHGTDEQQAYFLPKILNGEHIWCQGYSEPNAGSDLANVKTKARLEAEGLFSPARKQPLPYLPDVIGVGFDAPLPSVQIFPSTCLCTVTKALPSDLRLNSR